MLCPNCGNQIPDGSKFCGACGAPLGEEPGGTERVLTQDPSLPEKQELMNNIKLLAEN